MLDKFRLAVVIMMFETVRGNHDVGDSQTDSGDHDVGDSQW